MALSFDVSNAAGLGKLNEHLASRSYITGCAAARAEKQCNGGRQLRCACGLGRTAALRGGAALAWRVGVARHARCAAPRARGVAHAVGSETLVVAAVVLSGFGAAPPPAGTRRAVTTWRCTWPSARRRRRRPPRTRRAGIPTSLLCSAAGELSRRAPTARAAAHLRARPTACVAPPRSCACAGDLRRSATGQAAHGTPVRGLPQREQRPAAWGARIWATLRLRAAGRSVSSASRRLVRGSGLR
jgi:hypothetical protein